jgi:hypothetical protein
MITKFIEYNNIRYTFIHNLYYHYNKLTDGVPFKDGFEEHLKLMSSSYIWNIYKHLTQDFLLKTAHIPYHLVEANMRDKILQPLKDEVMKIQDFSEPN